MFWKFVVGTLVLPCCLGLETASATNGKNIHITPESEKLELLSLKPEQEFNLEKISETLPVQSNYKISHHTRQYRKRHNYKRHHYQRRQYNPHYYRNYRRIDYYDKYQDCPEYRRTRENYYPNNYRREAYPINDMIYRRHYHRRH